MRRLRMLGIGQLFRTRKNIAWFVERKNIKAKVRWFGLYNDVIALKVVFYQNHASSLYHQHRYVATKD